jgi:serine/threonine protein kinase
VRTLRDVLGVTSPAELSIQTGAFPASPSKSGPRGIGAWIDLRRGQRIRNAENGNTYLVGHRIGHGGFGVVYRAQQVSGHPLASSDLCLKVCGDVSSWHCEAYFGQLLQRESRVVRAFDSFAWTPRTKDMRPRYCLVTEFLEHGDLVQYFLNHPSGFSESKACG